MDRFPKKKCKFCGDPKPDHFPYACRENPKNKNRFSTVSNKPSKPMKRSRLNPIGKVTKKWIETREEWLQNNPPPIDGKYWLCYLQIHPWCPKKLTRETITLDHVVARTRDQSKRFEQSNLKPACSFCNEMKGSRSEEQARAI